MGSFKEIIVKSGIMDKDDTLDLIDDFIKINNVIIESFFRLLKKEIEQNKDFFDNHNEETKAFVNQLKNVDISSNLEDEIFKVNIPYIFRQIMINYDEKELSQYLSKQLAYVYLYRKINRRLMSQIIGIATQPIVNIGREYYLFVLKIFVEHKKQTITFPDKIIEIIKEYIKYSIKDIYESNEKSLFCNLNEIFNINNKFFKEHQWSFNKLLSFKEYSFFIKYVLCLKKYTPFSKEIKQNIIEVLISQSIIQEIDNDDDFSFEREGKKEVKLIKIDSNSIFYSLEQLESDYSIFQSGDEIREEELPIKFDLFKAYIFSILFDEQEIIIDNVKNKKYLLEEEEEKFNLRMREFLKDHLVNKYGNEWFTKGVPDDIRNEIENKIRNDLSKEPYKIIGNQLYKCTINNYKSIILHNWREIFENIFKSKSTLKKNVEDLNTLRNAYSHSDPNVSKYLTLNGEAAICWFKEMIGF